MGQCRRDKERKRAACILCTLFLVIILILLLSLYFSLYKPKDPNVQVPSMQLLSVTSTPNYSALISLTCNLQVSINNPNRGDFYVESGSIAYLYFQGAQIASTQVPTGIIPSQASSTVSITLAVLTPIQLIPSTVTTSSTSTDYGLPDAPYSAATPDLVPLTTAVVIQGHVTTANVFSYHADVVSRCDMELVLAYPQGQIQQYTCIKSYSLS